MGLLTLLLLQQLCSGSPATAADNPIITWASHPVLPDQTVLLQVSPFTNGSKILLQSTSTTSGTQAVAPSVTLEPLFVSDAGVAVVVPPSFPHHAVYTASVEGSAAPPVRINAPDLFWAQGSEGDSTTPGGWIRVFGRSLSFVPVGLLALDAPPVGWTTTLRLSPATVTGGGVKPTIVTADYKNLSSFSAFFRVPAGMPAGEYDIAVSNGPSGYVELDSFVHPDQPHLRSITIAEPRPAPTVVNWDPELTHGINETGQDLLIDSSDHLRRALAKAGEGPPGPKVLQLERGWYAVAGAFKIPNDVTIRGAAGVRKNRFWGAIFLPKMIVLPRQARDKT